jgi:predicted anti-sigma-YlaC factor YlaD
MTSESTGCPEYSASLEDRLESAVAGGPPSDLASLPVDAKLDAHLAECAVCRAALEDAEMAHQLIRDESGFAASPLAQGKEQLFAARVMAVIREETARRMAIWRPLELLASRFALAAAVVLLALSVYLAEFAPPFHMPAMSSQSEATQVEIGTGMPEPPAQPADQDEVLTSLAERTNDF